MSSNIVSTTIDAEYPVAGQDNDTQGFRDNFSIIKDSLAAAKAEVEELQDDTAKVNTGNDFSGNDISDANLVQITEEFIELGTFAGSFDFSFLNGHYQTAVISDNLAVNFVDWPPSGKLAKMRIELIPNNATQKTLSFTSEAGGILIKSSDFPSPFTIENFTNHYIMDVWTYDGGNTVYMKYVGLFV